LKRNTTWNENNLEIEYSFGYTDSYKIASQLDGNFMDDEVEKSSISYWTFSEDRRDEATKYNFDFDYQLHRETIAKINTGIHFFVQLRYSAGTKTLFTCF